jgi:uncharacterized membrane protein
MISAPVIVIAMIMLVILPLFGFAWWLWRIGARTISGERYPPEGVRVIGRGIELHGEAARRRGRLAQVFAAFLILAAAVFAAMTWRLLGLLSTP